MTVLGYILTVLLLILAGCVIAGGWSTINQIGHLDQKDQILFIQIVITLISAVAVAVLTATVGRSNEHLRAKLNRAVGESTEELRGKIGKEVQESISKLNSALAISVNATTETLKAELTKSGDEFRAELGELVPKRHAAYHAMWAAASRYFRALQKFEAGEYSEQELKEANKACEEALGQGLLVEAEDDSKFHDFWQEATFLFEKGEQRRSLPDGLKSIWRNEGRTFGEQYEQLRRSFANRLLA